MENINGKIRASFRWTLSCATMGLAASVSLCFAQGDRNAPWELQRVQPFACDSLDPKVCFDIYQRRMEQLPEPTPDLGWLTREQGQAIFGKSFLPGLPKAFDQPNDWNTAVPAPFEPPKIANPVLGLIDPPYDWFTYFRRVPWPPGTVQSGK
jgi:hypothetical protein